MGEQRSHQATRQTGDTELAEDQRPVKEEVPSPNQADHDDTLSDFGASRMPSER
jgi:hypothetical protein